ncbi:MAG: hypothetical protein ABSB74_17275 [Tepidisphaeraceae bacterium]
MLKRPSEIDRLTHSTPRARQTQSVSRPLWHENRPAKFNVFQRLVRQWEQFHPYNGAQVIKIRGQADLAASRSAWIEALEALNLGALCISENSYHYRCLNGEAITHGVMPCPDGTKLDQWISDEMNCPFEAFGGVPFRPFLLQEAGHFWMGVCYQHWVADSASIRMLMREWFVRQFDPPAASRRPVRIHAGGYLSLFGPHRDRYGAAEALMSSLRWHCQFRRIRRIEDRKKFQDMSQRFALFNAPEGLIDGLCVTARQAGATVNDVFLAAIAQVCDQHVPVRRKLRRRDLAVGTIVDLRPSADRPLGDVFDLLLGFTSICGRARHLGDWQTLLASVARQTRRQKLGGLPLASSFRMLVGLIAGKYLSREGVIELYRKRVSLAGANSNVNLNRCWPAKYHGHDLLDYIRVAPTGPMTPLVFTTTTLGKGLSVGLTYRPAIIPPERAALLGATFIDRLREVAPCRSQSAWTAAKTS